MKMQEFDYKQRILKKFNSLYDIVKQGGELGIDFQFILEKLDRMKKTVEDGVIKLVLLGSFSDGKTSTIAGLFGKLEDFMKIDVMESTDDVRALGLKNGFEIIDTPGLFGSKEKKMDGQNVRFSDITKNYISEAHIVVYLCDAVNPLKDSHAPVIRKVLRDLNKLDSAIFIINKMDETDVDILDDDDYARVSEIKKNALIGRLRSTIELTQEEERKLNIVCISADPNGKGLEYWFQRWDDYKKRSHIDLLRKTIDYIIEKTDALKLQAETSDNSVNAMLECACQCVDKECALMNESVSQSKKIVELLEDNAGLLKKDLMVSQTDVKKRLMQMHNLLISGIDGMNLETAANFVEREIGVITDKKTGKSQVTFWKLKGKITSIFEECGASNQIAYDSLNGTMNFEEKYNESNEIVTNALKKGLGKGLSESAKYLGAVNVNGEMVKAARNIFAKSYRFKPWEAVKMADKVNDVAKNFASVLQKAAIVVPILITACGVIRNFIQQRKLQELKGNLKTPINEFFSNCIDWVSNTVCFEKLAPGYVNLVNVIENQKNELENLQKKVEELERFKARYDKWVCDNVQDAEIVN